SAADRMAGARRKTIVARSRRERRDPGRHMVDRLPTKIEGRRSRIEDRGLRIEDRNTRDERLCINSSRAQDDEREDRRADCVTPSVTQFDGAPSNCVALYFNEKWLQSHGRSDGRDTRARTIPARAAPHHLRSVRERIPDQTVF